MLSHSLALAIALHSAVLATAGTAADQSDTVTPRRPHNDMFGAWSPDGRQIAFTSDRSGDPEIYIADSNGSNLKRLTHTLGRDAHPSWSADGRSLLFQSPRECGNVRIFQMQVDGSSQHRMAPTTGFCGVPSWSPDRQSIAFQCSMALEGFGTVEAPWRVYLLEPGNPMPRAVTNGPGNDQVPNWSPDGKRILFYSNRSGTDQLYELKLATQSVRQLTFGPASHSSASYAPDGKRIALMRAEPRGKSDAYVLTERGRLIRITNTGPEFGTPQFSPDGKRLLLQLPTAEGWRLFIAHADGRGTPQLVEFFPQSSR